MERINTLLDKIRELNSKKDPGIIDIDLMTDYVRVIYADLLEWRSKIAFNNAVTLPNQEEETDLSDTPMEHAEVNDSPAPVVELSPEIPDENSLQLQQQSAPVFIAVPSYVDIRKRIGINDKYLFISELFGNNKDAYEEVISEINTFDTEEDAIAWLNGNVSNQFNWQDDAETVQTFFMLLSDHFSSR